MVFLELKGDDEVELSVLYKRLLDCYFCCGIIGRQFKECATYEGQLRNNCPMVCM